MSNANPSVPAAPRNPRSGASRRSMLSMIPAAILAGWQGLASRSKASAVAAAGSAPEMQITPDGYSYVAAEVSATDPIEPATGDCCILGTAVYVYDEHGRIVQQRTIWADGSTVYHQYEGAQAGA